MTKRTTSFYSYLMQFFRIQCISRYYSFELFHEISFGIFGPIRSPPALTGRPVRFAAQLGDGRTNWRFDGTCTEKCMALEPMDCSRRSIAGHPVCSSLAPVAGP